MFEQLQIASIKTFSLQKIYREFIYKIDYRVLFFYRQKLKVTESAIFTADKKFSFCLLG
jgi:hypothetical protein